MIISLPPPSLSLSIPLHPPLYAHLTFSYNIVTHLGHALNIYTMISLQSITLGMHALQGIHSIHSASFILYNVWLCTYDSVMYSKLTK